MNNKIIKKISITFIIGIVIAIVGYLIASLISQSIHSLNIKDTLFIEGIFVVFISIIAMTSSDSLNLNILGLGIGDKTRASLEAIQQEHKLKDDPKKFIDANTIKLNFNCLTFLVGGIFIILTSFFYFNKLMG